MMATFTGSTSNDTIGSGAEDDTLHGLQGDDHLFAWIGNDTLEGGDGADYLAGAGGDDRLDGGAGRDTAAFHVPEGTPGSFRLVQGTGAEAGNLIVELVDGANVQAVFRIQLTADGAVVTGLGVAAGQGTDTAINVEELHFLPDNTPFDPNRFLGVGLAPSIYTDPGQPDFAHVGGSVRDEVLDLAVLVPQATNSWNLNADGGALGADTILGHDGNNWVRGNGGDDSLSGRGGDDYQMGDAGADAIDGGAGRDSVGYELPIGTTGTLQAVAGTGADAGKQLVQLVNGGAVETLFVITQTSAGAFTVQGVNSAASLGTDTVVNTESLHVHIATAPGTPPAVQINVELLPHEWVYEPNHHVGVNGTNFDETIDLAAFHQDKDATWMRFANGHGGNDSLRGTDLGEHLFGNDGDDTLAGQGGDDNLNGGTGADLLSGGDGRDTASFELQPGFTGQLRTAAGPSAGTLYIQRVDGAVTENLYLITQTGQGQFTVEGLGALAGQGTDVVSGVEGMSFYLPNTPTSLWIPVAANPWVYEPNHHIGVDGSAFDDQLDLNLFHGDKDATWGRFNNAGEGNDAVTGTGFNETIHGQGGNDTISAGGGADTATGGDGNDSIAGGDGADRFFGGRGADTMVGGQGDDVIILADGNPAVPRENGDDVIDGGADFDLVSFWSVTSPITVHLFNTGPQWTGFGNLTLTGVEGIEGGRGADNLHGDDNNNFITGGFTDAPTGNDNLSGYGGADTLAGRDGDDYLTGGAGDDFVHGGAGRDIAAFHLPAGTTGSFRLVEGAGADAGFLFVERVDGATVEQIFRIQLTGPGGAIVTGLGSAAGLGTDTVALIEELHVLVPQDPFNPNQFLSVNLTPSLWTDPNGAKQAHLTGSVGSDSLNLGLAVPAAQADAAWNVNANGGFGDDTIIGTLGNNYLRGDGGADSLSGGAGDDNQLGDAGNDVIDGGAGVDSVGFELPAGTVGILQTTQGQGADAGKVLVQLVNGGSTETVFAITQVAPGEFTVEGRGSAASFGTDTVRGTEGLDVYVANPNGPPPTSVWLNLAPNAWVYEPNQDVGVNGTAFADMIDLATYHQDKDATWDRFVNAGGGNDQVSGTELNEGLNGDAGDDTLNAGGGNDYIRGGDGDDRIDGGAGTNDIAAYSFAPGTPGTYAQVEGQGADAGKLFIERTANGVTERIFEISFTGSGETLEVTVRGLGSAASLGTDVVRGVEQLHFLTDPFDPSLFTNVNLAPFIPPAAPGSFVNGGAAGDVIDLAAIYPSIGSGALLGANGNGGADSISGHAGPNILNGGSGGDTLHGQGGDDQLRGDAGDDSLVGGAGNDLLRGNRGVDAYDGGEGTDRISFYDLSATQGVVADLATGVISDDGFGNTETMVSIEGLGAGTRFADFLAGNDGDNLILGGWQDTLLGRGGNDTFQVGGAAATVDGGAGVDELYFSQSRTVDANNDGVGEEQTTTNGVWVDLGQQRVLDDGFGQSGVVIGIENLGGTQYADTLVGDAGANEFAGYEGNDSLVGGAGSDSAWYFGARSDFQVDALADGTVRVTDLRPGAPSGVDILSGVETLVFNDQTIPVPVYNPVITGTEGNDNLAGTAGDDTIVGLGGDDSLNGLEGNDSINAGGGSDFLIGQGGHDTLSGGDGHDFFSGGAGDDRIDGGGGLDRVSFFQAPNGVRVNLGVTTAQDTGWGVDTLVNIEHVSGTAGADTLTGNAGANWLWSTGGADSMNGQAGDDLISIGPGNATVSGGTGVDALSFFGNGDGYASGVNVTLATAGAQATGHGTIYVSAVENLSGSLHGDTLTGNGLNNVLAGEVGNDVLNGGAGADTLSGDGWIELNSDGLGGSGVIETVLNPAVTTQPHGNDVLNGGDGDDRLIGGGGNDTLNGGAGVDTAVFSGARSGYSVVRTSGGYRVTDTNLADGDDGTDILTGLERIQFADTVMSLGQTVGFSQSSISRNEGGQGTTTSFTYTVTRSGDVSGALDMTYTVRGAGADPADAGDIVGFNGSSMTGVVRFAAGQTTATVTVQVAGDRTVENNEGFSITLNRPAGADVTFARQTAGGTIWNDDMPFQLRPLPWPVPGGFGDPHLSTLDGLQYEMQGVGEFVLLESVRGTPVTVQVRTEAVNDYASEITAVAARVGDARVMIDAATDTLRVNGAAIALPASGVQELASGGSIAAYVQDGANGWVITFPDSGGSALVVIDRGDRLDVGFAADPARTGDFRGLLGDFNGQAADDLASRDGAVLSANPTLDELFAHMDSWRITQAESLFTYGPGESTATFQDLTFRPIPVTLSDFPTELVEAANAAADAAGLTAGAVRDAAIRDFLMTGDATYFDSGRGAPSNPQVVNVVAPPDTTMRVGVGSTNADQVEGAGDGASYAFTVYRSSGEGTLTVGWSLAGAVFAGVTQGVDAADFGGVLPSGSVTFAEGETQVTVVVNVAGDLAFEGDEGFVFTIVGPAGTSVIAGSVQGRVLNDDAPAPPPGTNGDDDLQGSDRADDMDGGNGSDTLQGEGGADKLVGGNSDDVLFGGAGNDQLDGGNSSDRLDGGLDDDRLTGGNSADTLVGGAGDDVLEGGNSGDVFVFGAGFGQDRILDFDKSDVIHFLDGVFTSFDQVMSHAQQQGADVVITDDAGDRITLVGVSLSSLNGGDFLFG